jgi:hypothetical protein
MEEKDQLEPIYRYLKDKTAKDISLSMYFTIGQIQGAYDSLIKSMSVGGAADTDTDEINWPMFHTTITVSHRQDTNDDGNVEEGIGLSIPINESYGKSEWYYTGPYAADEEYGLSAKLLVGLVCTIVESMWCDTVLDDGRDIDLRNMLIATIAPPAIQTPGYLLCNDDDMLQCGHILIEEYRSFPPNMMKDNFTDWVIDLRREAREVFGIKEE